MFWKDNEVMCKLLASKTIPLPNRIDLTANNNVLCHKDDNQAMNTTILNLYDHKACRRQAGKVKASLFNNNTVVSEVELHDMKFTFLNNGI
jgi:hypothetical protein